MSASRLLTPEEAADLWGCTRAYIAQLAASGKLRIAQVTEIVTETGYRRVKLFDPRDVLTLRAAMKVSKQTAHGHKLRTSLAKSRQRATNAEKLRAYWRLPRDQRPSNWLQVSA